jgi:membrane glycosyltransferase
MNRRVTFLLALASNYVSLVALLVLVVPATNSGLTWTIWLACGVGTLSVTALELTFFSLWLWLKVTGRLHDDPYVPLEISDEELGWLERQSPKVAMLMPAHREVTTPSDADAFVERAVNLIRRSPRYVDLFFLFDSPPLEHDRELQVVQRVKAELADCGLADQAQRVRTETYRNKPPALRNKPGSIKMWLDRYRDEYEFMFVLDADSSLLQPDHGRPATCHPLERLVLAMRRHPELAMIQAAIDVNNDPTVWGWFQTVGVGMASKYHGAIFRWLLEGEVPSYGHNLLYRTADFAEHVKNTLEYLSHDFLDAADLQTAGRKCVHTYNVTTGEEGEASLLGYVVRDLRWARGNAQWTNYWMAKVGLPLGPRIYIAIGILCYLWPLIASLQLLTSVFLMHFGTPLISTTHMEAVSWLLVCVVASLVLPKALASRSLAAFNGSLLVGVLVSPSLMLLQGFLFLMGAFGKKWTLRGSRTARMDLEHARGILSLFSPISLLGLVLWTFFLTHAGNLGFGAILIRLHVLLLIASPLIALAVSWPVPDKALQLWRSYLATE